MTKAAFKDQYVAGHANAFRAAAKRYDLPVELVASVAHVELGNDDARNDIAYALRAEGGRDIPSGLGITETGRDLIRNINRPRAETSFGPYNIQQRRAAEILGYGDINAMSETARRSLVPTTRDPAAATFMLAKHLSDLRDQDFPGLSGKRLTKDMLRVVATSYKFGPEEKIESIKRKIEDGAYYISKWNIVKRLIT
ncbi:MAG: hypothetical protein AB7E60_13120 [Sphingobium sp.]